MPAFQSHRTLNTIAPGKTLASISHAVQVRARLMHQLLHRGVPLAARGLVGGHDHVLQARGVVQRFQRDDHLDRRAVGVRDDPLRAVRGRRHVHLGDDQRHGRVHPPGARVVDDHRAGGRRNRSVLARHARPCAEERNLDPRERARLQLLHGDLAPGERELRPRAAPARERDEALHGEPPLLECPQHLATDRSGRTHDGNDIT